MHQGTSHDELARSISERVAIQLDRPSDAVTLDTALADLVVDSIDVIEIAIDLEEDHGVWFEHDDLTTIGTIADLVALVERRIVTGAPT